LNDDSGARLSDTHKMDDSLNTPEILALRRAIRPCLLAGMNFSELACILATEIELLTAGPGVEASGIER